jgi:branched-chain amino acid transport system ATP-binding protein
MTPRFPIAGVNYRTAQEKQRRLESGAWLPITAGESLREAAREVPDKLAHRGGDIRFDGRSILGLPPHRIARLGIGLVPEGRQLFPSLSIRENLDVMARAGASAAPLIRQQIWQTLHRLKTEGLSLLVVDKNLRALSKIADSCYVLERGRTVWRGSGAELAAERENVERMLTV